jgi:hypothetical protein
MIGITLLIAVCVFFLFLGFFLWESGRYMQGFLWALPGALGLVIVFGGFKQWH